MTTPSRNVSEPSTQRDAQQGVDLALKLLDDASLSRYERGYRARWQASPHDPRCSLARRIAILAAILAGVCLVIGAYVVMMGLLLVGGSIGLLSPFVLGFALWPPRARTVTGRALDAAELTLQNGHAQTAFQGVARDYKCSTSLHTMKGQAASSSRFVCDRCWPRL